MVNELIGNFPMVRSIPTELYIFIFVFISANKTNKNSLITTKRTIPTVLGMSGANWSNYIGRVQYRPAAQLFAIRLLNVTVKRNNPNSTKPEGSSLFLASNTFGCSLLRSFHSLHTQLVRWKDSYVHLSSCVCCFFQLRLVENCTITLAKRLAEEWRTRTS